MPSALRTATAAASIASRRSPRAARSFGARHVGRCTVLHVVDVRRDLERGNELQLRGVGVAASHEQAGPYDVHPERGHALRVGCERGARGVVGIVPVAELERDHRRVARAGSSRRRGESRAGARTPRLRPRLGGASSRRPLWSSVSERLTYARHVSSTLSTSRAISNASLQQRDPFVELREPTERGPERVARVPSGRAVTGLGRDLDCFPTRVDGFRVARHEHQRLSVRRERAGPLHRRRRRRAGQQRLLVGRERDDRTATEPQETAAAHEQRADPKRVPDLARFRDGGVDELEGAVVVGHQVRGVGEPVQHLEMVERQVGTIPGAVDHRLSARS